MQEQASSNPEIKVETTDIDHLGIIAGIVDHIGLVDEINRQVGTNAQEHISAGTVVKAMILNFLGFLSRPLYLLSQFFIGKPVEHLLGKGIEVEHLNDDKIGRTLDALWEADLSSVFVGVSLKAQKKIGVIQKAWYLDSSSMHVHGQYNKEEGEAVVKIVKGHSKDHRPDLKQFLINLLVGTDEGIPSYFSAGNGNDSDSKKFTKLIKQFKDKVALDGTELFVADSALYSQDNIRELGSLPWLTRVPERLSKAKELVEQTDESKLETSGLEGYKMKRYQINYASVAQRWLLVQNDKSRQSELEEFEEKLSTARQTAETNLANLGKKEFACEKEARKAAEQFEKKLKYHQLVEIQTIEQHHYDKPGRPTKEAVPSETNYAVSAKLVENSEQIERCKNKAGRFILATNQLSAEDRDEISKNSLANKNLAPNGALDNKLEEKTPNPTDSNANRTESEQSPTENKPDADKGKPCSDEPIKEFTNDELLQSYKDRQCVERGFRFLKDPWFFTSSIFVKTARRVAALAMIMALSLLVYTIAQRMMRQNLLKLDQSIPNQLGKPTQRPTLRWIFQCFQAVHLIWINGVQQISNLTEARKHILKFFVPACQRYYLIE